MWCHICQKLESECIHGRQKKLYNDLERLKMMDAQNESARLERDKIENDMTLAKNIASQQAQMSWRECIGWRQGDTATNAISFDLPERFPVHLNNHNLLLLTK